MQYLKTLILFSSAAAALGSPSAAAPAGESPDYSQGGCFVLNEDWYGHSNSTLNWLSDAGEWTYRAFQKANDGREIGATACHAALHGGRLYIVAKQPKDPGASTTGGRLTVCDAQTLECLAQHEQIAPDAAGGTTVDGRAFLGIDSRKAYVSSNNGIYPYDLRSQTFGPQIPGSGNPGDDPYAALYRGQCGTMVAAGDTVYAVHQSAGLLLIDTKSDRVARTIQAPRDGSVQRGFGSIVRSRDGALWLSVCAGADGSGSAAPYLIRLDPATGDTLRLCLPDSILPPSNSWFAWTADAFCASAAENALYWSGAGSSWFGGGEIFKYDIDRGKAQRLVNLAAGGWRLYGASMGIHPRTGELYLSLCHDFNDPTYIVRRYDCQGRLLREYAMINYYWFPGPFLFPEAGDVTGIGAPEADSLRISCDGRMLTVENAAGAECSLYDTSGRLLRSFRCTEAHHREECALPPGLYLVRLTHGGQAASRKFLVP